MKRLDRQTASRIHQAVARLAETGQGDIRTLQLRPHLTWHDGTPMLAEDFVFAWRVYATSESQ